MKYLRNILLALSLIFVLTSCASTPTQSQADHGLMPTQWEDAVVSHLDRNLKDPDSLTDFSFLTPSPRKGFLNYGAFTVGPTGKRMSNPLWYVCAEYRAKNSFGAYVGLNQYVFFLYDNRVVHSIQGMTDRNSDFGNTRYSCYPEPV